MKQPLVYIVIINWNGYKDTSELLESLLKINYANFKIVVVDNNSSQSEAEKLRKNYSDKVHIIFCKDNLGFSGGNNVGINYSLEEKADYLLLLNNDTTVEANFLEFLVKKFETNNKTGIVAPQINYYDEPNKVWSEGGNISRIRGSGFAYSDKLKSEVEQSDKSVSFVSGCCMLIRREVFETIGLFDERFFLYIEDTDFCYRAGKEGYKIIVSHDSIIFHKVGSSTRNNFYQLPIYYATRNRLYFAKKNFSNTYYLTTIYLSLAMLFKSILWFLTGRFNNIIAVNKAFSDFFKGKMGKTDPKNLSQG